MRKQVACICDHRFEVEFPGQVDLSRSPEMEEAILKGSFLTTKCPKCGKLFSVEVPVRLQDAGRQLDLFLIPEEDRREYLAGTLPYPVENARRVVIGYEEMVEKLLLHRDGLDDRCVELIKYHLLKRALQEYEEPADTVRVLFAGKTMEAAARDEVARGDTVHDEANARSGAHPGTALTFHLHGLRKDEVAVVRVPQQKYDQVLAGVEQKLREAPFDRLLAPPYVSINNLYRPGPDASEEKR
jgi:hypothetical protein